jgi:hypothetical protein
MPEDGVERRLEFDGERIDFAAFPATPFATRPKEEVKGDHASAAKAWKGDALRICLSKSFSDYLEGDLSNFPIWQMRLEQEFSRLNIMFVMHENPSKTVVDIPLLRAATSLLVASLSNQIALSLRTELRGLDLQHPATLYFALACRWNAMAHTRRHALQQSFMNVRIGKDEFMASLWKRMEDIVTQLTAAGIQMQESEVVEGVIRACVGRRDFDHPTNMLLSQPPGSLTIAEARRQYSAWEELTQLRRKEGAAALGAEAVGLPEEGAQVTELKSELARMSKAHEELSLALARNANRSRQPGAGSSSAVCWNCGKKGHLSRNCYTKSKEDSKLPK